MTSKVGRVSFGRIIAYALAIVLLLIVVTPFITAIVSTFKNTEDFYGTSYVWLPSKWNWHNYIDTWNWTTYGRFMFNSVVCAVLVTIFATLVSSMAAFGFARIHFFGRNVIFYLVLLTQGVPFMVLFVPTYLMMNKMGLLNSYWGLILPLISFPTGTFMMRQAMIAIPMDYEYAAKIDGCNRFTMFWRVFLPLVKNTLIALGIFTFMSSWNNYLWPLVVVSQRDMYTLPLGLQLYSNTRAVGSRPEWNMILCAAVMSALPILIVYCFMSRRLMEGITLGGIKG